MKRWLGVGVLVLVLAGLIGWRVSQKKSQTAAQAQSTAARRTAAVTVSLATAKRRDIVQTFDTIGNVEAPFNVHISPKASGEIDYLQVREGDHVVPGQLLVRLDPSQLQAGVSQQEANVAEAQFRLSQAKLTEAPTNAGVNTQIIQQAAGLSTAGATLNQAREDSISAVEVAQAAVRDAQGRVDAAKAGVNQQDANVRSAQANLNNAQTKYNRTYALYKQAFTAAQDVDDARTAVQVAEGALDVAQRMKESAVAALNSAAAQRKSAQEQLSIAKTKANTDLAAAQATVKQAKASLYLARSNTAQKPAYQENLSALQAAVSAAQAQLHDAQVQLTQTDLRSPIDGFVTARSADPGSLATPGQSLLTLESIRQVYVSVSIPEDVSRRIFLGQTGTVRVDALPGRSFTGKVTQMNPSADPASRQFITRITIDNPTYLLKPGMFSRISLVTQSTPNALVVPREAVTQGANGSTVTVVGSDNVAHTRAVTTKPGDASRIIIVSGLRPGEKVVIMATRAVKDGQKVRVGGKGGNKGAAGGGSWSSDQSRGGGSPNPNAPAGSNTPSGGQNSTSAGSTESGQAGQPTPGAAGAPNATPTSTPAGAPATGTAGSANGGANSPGAAGSSPGGATTSGTGAAAPAGGGQ